MNLYELVLAIRMEVWFQATREVRPTRYAKSPANVQRILYAQRWDQYQCTQAIMKDFPPQ